MRPRVARDDIYRLEKKVRRSAPYWRLSEKASLATHDLMNAGIAPDALLPVLNEYKVEGPGSPLKATSMLYHSVRAWELPDTTMTTRFDGAMATLPIYLSANGNLLIFSGFEVVRRGFFASRSDLLWAWRKFSYLEGEDLPDKEFPARMSESIDALVRRFGLEPR